MNNRKLYKIDDSVIMQFVRLVQLGFLTKTDVVDHFRQIVLEPADDKSSILVLTPEYLAKAESDIGKLLDEAAERMETANNSKEN